MDLGSTVNAPLAGYNPTDTYPDESLTVYTPVAAYKNFADAEIHCQGLDSNTHLASI